MKLQIKTLSQKSILIDMDDTKTVLDLKKELAMYPDVGVQPELQKLIYAGKILTNEDQLSAYNIDVKKFLVVMVLKQPAEESAGTSKQAAAAATAVAAPEETSAAPSVATTKDGEFRKPPSPATPATPAASTKSEHEEMVDNIVSMGYPKSEVRRALAASFNNPERAIEYLIEGIPTSPAAPAGTGFTDDETMSPFEVFRRDPLFRNLRRAIQQHPELINDAIQRVGEANPNILSLIDENQEEFLSMLIEGSDDDDDDDDGAAASGM